MLLLKAARVLHCSSSSSYTRFCMRTRLGSCFWHRTSSSSSSAFSATRPVRSTVDNGPSTASTGGTTARVGGEPELIKKEDSTVPESFLLYEKTSKVCVLYTHSSRWYNNNCGQLFALYCCCCTTTFSCSQRLMRYVQLRGKFIRCFVLSVSHVWISNICAVCIRR